MHARLSDLHLRHQVENNKPTLFFTLPENLFLRIQSTKTFFMSEFQYPPSPAFVDTEKLNPSSTFKKQITKTIFSIALFFAVYILLVVAAIGLAIACFYFGVVIITAIANFLSIVAGLGLMAVGVSVIFFLIKFIFAVTKNENPTRIEIFETDQAELFDFIRKLSNETKTPFPKKIFISPDVNACVFYNSSFWSMIFPVRKNLEIGLGLVNSINLSELKAVIAHEFGHFSQRSMKLGSFTYNVNRIIYDMLYNNKSYTKFLNAWGRLHGVLSFFANITVNIAEGIQYILRKMYSIINKNYLGLSREMEFHADAVAASVAGGNNIISGLSRIEVASSCYNTTLNKANEWLKDKKRMDNVYDNQLIVFRSLVSKYNLQDKKGLPDVSFDFIQSFYTSRVNYKNQWASHPELSERKAHLDQLSITVPADESSAWIVFEQPEKLQQEVTAKLYSFANTTEPLQSVDSSVFNDQYKKETDDGLLPLVYKGYYDSRYIDVKDWSIDDLLQSSSTKNFDEIFNAANAQLQSSINSNAADINLVKAIKDKQIDTNSFDFDGIKYNLEDCETIIQQLEKEIAETEQKLKQLDKEAFVYFKNTVPHLGTLYADFKITSEKAEECTAVVNDLLDTMRPLYRGGLTVDQVHSIIRAIKNKNEIQVKARLRVLISDGTITKEINSKLYNCIEQFLNKNYVYYESGKFLNNELDELSEIAIQSTNVLNDYRFKQYKYLLQEQLSDEKIN